MVPASTTSFGANQHPKVSPHGGSPLLFPPAGANSKLFPKGTPPGRVRGHGLVRPHEAMGVGERDYSVTTTPGVT
jgi:hypothetical protein